MKMTLKWEGDTGNTVVTRLTNGEKVSINWWYCRDQYQDLIFRGAKFPFGSMRDAKWAAELMNLVTITGNKEAETLTPLEKAEQILESDGSGYQDDAEVLTHALMYVITHLREKEEK